MSTASTPLTSGIIPNCAPASAPDAVVELRRICLEVAHEFPHVVFFAGKLVWDTDEIEGFYRRFLHNHTALELQSWLQLYGYSLVILPIRVGAGSMSIRRPPKPRSRRNQARAEALVYQPERMRAGAVPALLCVDPRSLPNRSDPIKPEMVATILLDA